jgi:hypothetical protein
VLIPHLEAKLQTIKFFPMSTKNKDDQEIPADLKHDTMEFAAPTEGEDILNADAERYEPDEISAEELEAINDTEDNEAAALVAEQDDFELDETNLPTEDWTDDIEDEKDDEDKEENRRR